MHKYVDNLSVKKKNQHERCWFFNVYSRLNYPHADVTKIVYDLRNPCGKAVKPSISRDLPHVENRLLKKEQGLT